MLTYQFYGYHHSYTISTLLYSRIATTVTPIQKFAAHGFVNKNILCTAMMVSNLAEPDWVNVLCFKNLTIFSVLCAIPNNGAVTASWSENNLTHQCFPLAMNRKSACLSFHWVDRNLFADYTFGCERFISESASALDELHFLINAVSSTLPPLILGFNQTNNSVHTFQYTRYLTRYTHRVSVMNAYAIPHSGFFVCSKKLHKPLFGDNVFSCDTGVKVSVEHLCEASSNTLFSECDEKFCSAINASEESDHVQRRVYCGSLNFISVKGTCRKHLPEKKVIQRTITYGVVNVSMNCKLQSEQFLDDLFPDCLLGEDELVLKMVLVNDSHTKCKNKTQLPCLKGHSKCFNISSICEYTLDVYNHLFPCRNGGHLESCSAFECSKRHKCYKSYCVHWASVCDGKWDCAEGSEEMRCSREAYNCLGMYKCHKTSSICIHMGCVCDDIDDCPFADDEGLCELAMIHCPHNCLCLALAVRCKQHTVIESVQRARFHPYIAVFLLKVPLLPTSNFRITFPSALSLKIHHCNLTRFGQEIMHRRVILLDVSHNNISILEKLWQSVYQLKVLCMQSNLVSHIKSHSFQTLSRLIVINISSNPLQCIESDAFLELTYLKIVLVEVETETKYAVNIFQNSTVKVLFTKDHHLCCLAPEGSVCTEPRPWYLPCSDIFASLALKTLFILFSQCILLLNLVSVVFYVKGESFSKVFSVSVVATNINHISLAAYLTTIWIADLTLEGRYVVHGRLWQSGGICFLAFGVFLNYTFFLQLSSIFSCTARLMVVITPIDSKFKRTSFTLKFLTLLLLFSLLLSATLTLSAFFTTHFLSTSVCSPFIDPSKSSGVQQSVALFASLSQTLSFVTILSQHVQLLRELKASEKDFQGAKSKLTPGLITQIVLLTSSNFLCWFSSGTIYMVCMFLERYPVKLIKWATVLTTPLNSLFCPIIDFAFALKHRQN